MVRRLVRDCEMFKFQYSKLTHERFFIWTNFKLLWTSHFRLINQSKESINIFSIATSLMTDNRFQIIKFTSNVSHSATQQTNSYTNRLEFFTLFSFPLERLSQRTSDSRQVRRYVQDVLPIWERRGVLWSRLQNIRHGQERIHWF